VLRFGLGGDFIAHNVSATSVDTEDGPGIELAFTQEVDDEAR